MATIGATERERGSAPKLSQLFFYTFSIFPFFLLLPKDLSAAKNEGSEKKSRTRENFAAQLFYKINFPIAD